MGESRRLTEQHMNPVESLLPGGCFLLENPIIWGHFHGRKGVEVFATFVEKFVPAAANQHEPFDWR